MRNLKPILYCNKMELIFNSDTGSNFYKTINNFKIKGIVYLAEDNEVVKYLEVMLDDDITFSAQECFSEVLVKSVEDFIAGRLGLSNVLKSYFATTKTYFNVLAQEVSKDNFYRMIHNRDTIYYGDMEAQYDGLQDLMVDVKERLERVAADEVDTF